MTGKAALHAEQLGTINNLFSPSPEAVTLAYQYWERRGRPANGLLKNKE
jgi:citrate lyase beta subunit